MSDHCHVILCRRRCTAASDTSDRSCRAFEEELLETLRRDASCEAMAVPHLYDLSADGPVLKAVRSLEGHLVLLAWLPTRASHWLLHRAGIRGSHGNSSYRSSDASSDPRRIWCLNLCNYRHPDDCAAEVRRILSLPGTLPAIQARPAVAAELEETTSPRWYPVIDYKRCANCLECLNFCLFGVYGLDDAEQIQVEQPDACRPGCPACARVCPSGAIMFPEHSDAAISGDTSRSQDGPPSGLPQTLPILDPLRQAAGEREAAMKTESVTTRPSPRSTPTDPRLEELVDGLDELDL